MTPDSKSNADTQQWSEEYQKILNSPPSEGDILRCLGGVEARLDVEIVGGRPPFVYGRAYIPCIVGEPVGWFLQPFDSETAHGWKCILLPKAREDCLRKRGLVDTKIKVQALKVVRASESGQSLLCEVAEYDKKEEQTDEQVS